MTGGERKNRVDSFCPLGSMEKRKGLAYYDRPEVGGGKGGVLLGLPTGSGVLSTA